MPDGKMRCRVRSLAGLFVAMVAITHSSAVRASDHDDLGKSVTSRLEYWRSAAFYCSASKNRQFAHFPSSQFSPSQSTDVRFPCNDNDMVLYMGLLCAAGESAGCDGVKNSQEPTTGQWFRNPQYRAGVVDPGGGADFSPDMALGVELYLVHSLDGAAAWSWLRWLDSISPCHNRILARCLDLIPPRFCRDDRCLMRPGDTVTLAAVVNYVQAKAKVPNLRQLPNGVLEGYLGTWGGKGGQLIESLGGAHAGCGYPQHLQAAATLLMRAMNRHDLDANAKAIAETACNRGNGFGNAFYDFVAYGATDQVLTDILASCPAAPVNSPALPNTWHWETTVADPTWRTPDWWDCIFAARLAL